MKKYENVTVKIDEDGSYISISEYGSPVASYRITTDEEKEYLQDRYASKAISSLAFFSLALVLPAAYLAISDFLNMNTLKSFMQHPFLSLLLVGFYLLAAAVCGFSFRLAFILQFKFSNWSRQQEKINPQNSFWPRCPSCSPVFAHSYPRKRSILLKSNIHYFSYAILILRGLFR